MATEREPDHPVLAEPWKYDIVGLEYHADPDTPKEDCLILALRREGATRRLRFTGVRNLRLEEGFPGRTGGLCITDISARGWEDCGVEVDDFENSGGGIYFYARDVEEIR